MIGQLNHQHFLIEYHGNKIKDYLFYDENTDDLEGKENYDPKSFVFSLKSYNSLEKPRKFNSKENETESFALTNDGDEFLFQFGDKDILIFSENRNDFSRCIQKNYDYEDVNNTLREETDYPLFEVKRIQVYQMYETDEQKEIRKKKFEKQLIEEKEAMKQYSKPFITDNEMKQIEEWTNMKFQEIIFDSEYCQWTLGNSTFDNHLFEKEKMIVIFENEDNDVFGGYISMCLDNLDELESEENNFYPLIYFDPNVFLFSLRSNGRLEKPTRFDFKKQEYMPTIAIGTKYESMLISFGIKDIIIPKKQYREYTMCEQNFFDYQDYENVFVRQRDEEIFTVKRFQVYQMYETEK